MSKNEKRRAVKRSKLRLSGAALASATFLVGVVAYPSSAAEPLPRPSGSVVETTRLEIPFSHPQTLQDATRTAYAVGHPVIGYRFENAEIVGEYSLASGVPIDEYLQHFSDTYGTQPQVTDVLIESSVQEAQSLASDLSARRQPLVVAAEGPEFIAPPIDPTKVDTAVARYRDLEAPEEARMTTAAASSWKPTQAEISVSKSGVSVWFEQYYYWDGVGGTTTAMHADDGWEAEVNIYTAHPDFQIGARGGLACSSGGDYKARPFAQNKNWNWWALVNTGYGMGGLASAVGAYADYNDLADACNRNSMAIGIRTPQAIPKYANGMQEVLLTIQAPQGMDVAGRMGGVVQAVNESGCFIQPWLSNTDCMGLTSSSAGSRITLNENRNWYGPGWCWQSFDYGNATPVRWSC